MRTAWPRLVRPRLAEPSIAPPRFDSADAPVFEGLDDILDMRPAFMRSLSRELDVESLAARLCPILLEDGTVAILALAEHVGGDQADALARHVLRRGYRLAAQQRYVLPAPLLLAIARGQVTPGTAARRNLPDRHAGTALSDAFQDMLEWGVRHEASDLHINIHLREPESEVRFTLSGRYVSPERFQRIPTRTLMDMLAVVWMDVRGGNGAVFDPSAEQQGSLVKRVDGRRVLLRWASLAAERGPSVCLRLLHRDALAEAPSLAALGYLPHQCAAIESAMATQGGAIVFSGAVGSGKSTSLAALIARVPSDRKVITLEDPVEYLIPNAVQNSVARELHETAHDDYGSKLRTLKRSAMNDVLLGEVRDLESGRAFLDLVGSGVNVYTTTHAASAALVGDRLASDFIGVPRDFLATPGVLKLLVHQALLPLLCSECCLGLADAAALQAPPEGARSWQSWLEVCDASMTQIPDACACAIRPDARPVASRALRISRAIAGAPWWPSISSRRWTTNCCAAYDEVKAWPISASLMRPFRACIGPKRLPPSCIARCTKPCRDTSTCAKSSAASCRYRSRPASSA